MSVSNERHSEDVDLEKAGRLVDELSRDLERIPAGSPDIERLKEEVRALKDVLESPASRHHTVKDGLHSIREGMHTALDAVVAQGVKGGQYIAEIGRILGL